jgi:Domain of unknown function (DUF4440)
MTRRLLSGILLAALVLGACNSGTAGASPAPVYPDAAGGAQPLVTKLFQLLKDKDTAGLEAFLSPAFTLQRADGSSADKADFVQRPAEVVQFTISGLTATQTDGLLVARYLADVVGTVNGRPYTPGPAPRLSVFIWDGTDWRLVAHANFNPLAG